MTKYILTALAISALTLACNPQKKELSPEDIRCEKPATVKRLTLTQFDEIYCVDTENGKHGPWARFDKEGKILMHGIYEKDVPNGHWRRFHLNGNVSLEGKLVAGKREGLWREFYLNGRKRSEKNYKNGLAHGETKIWFLNGQLMTKGELVNGLEEGTWEVWNDDGQLSRSCEMKAGKNVSCKQFAEPMVELINRDSNACEH